MDIQNVVSMPGADICALATKSLVVKVFRERVQEG